MSRSGRARTTSEDSPSLRLLFMLSATTVVTEDRLRILTETRTTETMRVRPAGSLFLPAALFPSSSLSLSPSCLAIYPCDFQQTTPGHIVDDEMHAIMVRPTSSSRPRLPSVPLSSLPSLPTFRFDHFPPDADSPPFSIPATPDLLLIFPTSTQLRERSRSQTFSPKLDRDCSERGCRTSRETWEACSRGR